MNTTRRSLATMAALVMAVTLAACTPTEEKTTVSFDGTHVDSAAFADAVAQPGVVVVDVRTPEEFADGHLPGAVNIDVSAPSFAERIREFDSTSNLAVYCRSANRSRVAMDALSTWGYPHTVGLEGGILAWTGDVVVLN